MIRPKSFDPAHDGPNLRLRLKPNLGCLLPVPTGDMKGVAPLRHFITGGSNVVDRGDAHDF